jgi:hypothetical protein
MNDKIAIELTREELRTLFFACHKQIADLSTLADAKPTMEESLREEATSLFAIIERLSAASR